jgi:hypothetical protein
MVRSWKSLALARNFSQSIISFLAFEIAERTERGAQLLVDSSMALRVFFIRASWSSLS